MTEANDYYGQEGVGFRLVTLTTLATPYSYGDYGTISLSDYASWASDSSYAGYNRLYENNHLYVYSVYSISAGYLVQDFLQFIPD